MALSAGGAKLREALARLGTEHLVRMVEPSTVQLLELLDERHLTASRLADLVLRQRGPEGLLLDATARRDILLALAPPDAQRLSRLVLGEDLPDPYTVLPSLSFRRGTAQTDILFRFFGCEPPTPSSREDLHPAAMPAECTYPLFAHQRAACRRACQLLAGDPPRVLLHMPTGSGKTRTAMNVIATFLRERLDEEAVVVWLAHTEELCEQAAEEFGQAWRALGNRAVSLFRHFGPYRVDLEALYGGFLVAGLRLLYLDSLNRQGAFFALARRTGLVVMDEAHQAVAPTYQHLLNLLTPTGRCPILGLSATPGRSWLNPEEDLKLAEFFARQKVTLDEKGYDNPVEYLQREGYLAKVEYERLPYRPGGDFRLSDDELRDIQQGLDLPESVLRRLAGDHRRNFLILTRIMREAERGAKILVFGCSVEHARTLANLLLTKGYRAAAVTAATLPDQRRRLIAQYRDTDQIQILTNFGVLTMGFDAPRTSVAVIARPTRSVVLYSQMVGRAARGPRAGGNPTCRVVTVVDDIPGFRSVAEAFRFWEDIWTS